MGGVEGGLAGRDDSKKLRKNQEHGVVVVMRVCQKLKAIFPMEGSSGAEILRAQAVGVQITPKQNYIF